MLYVATMMPYNIAFSENEVGVLYYIDLIVDFSFLFDTTLNFFSAYYDDEGKLITNNKAIAISYLKGWFIIDSLASFPFNLVEKNIEAHASITKSYNKILRLLRLPRLYKLLKMTRLIKILSVMKRNPFVAKF